MANSSEPRPPYTLIGVVCVIVLFYGAYRCSWDARVIAAAILLHRSLRRRPMILDRPL